jgi:PPOX class probable F420-dependent enzyme
MEQMDDAQWREFAAAGTRTGKLAVVQADGRPHVTPIWFLIDGNEIVFTTPHNSIKARAIRRDPRATLCVDDQQPMYSYVMIQGDVSLSDDPGDVRHWAALLGARYMGEDRAAEYGARNGVPGELLARLRITKVVAHRDVAS